VTLFLWWVIIHIALIGFFTWREWQKPLKDSYPQIIAGLVKYVSQSEKYSWVDWMLGRKRPWDIEKCLGYVNSYTKKWLIIASRKAFWWEAGWLALFCVSLIVRGRKRMQETPKIAPAREEYPPGHWEKKAEPGKVVEPEGKEEAKAPEGEDYEWLS
jgi:hypothetical protein